MPTANQRDDMSRDKPASTANQSEDDVQGHSTANIAEGDDVGGHSTANVDAPQSTANRGSDDLSTANLSTANLTDDEDDVEGHSTAN